VKPRVVEEPPVVPEPDERVRRPPESRAGEREPEALQQRIGAEGEEEEETGGEEEIRGDGGAAARHGAGGGRDGVPSPWPPPPSGARKSAASVSLAAGEARGEGAHRRARSSRWPTPAAR